MKTIQINSTEVTEVTTPKCTMYQFSIDNYLVTFIKNSLTYSIFNLNTKKQMRVEMLSTKSIEKVVKQVSEFVFHKDFNGKMIRCTALDSIN